MEAPPFPSAVGVQLPAEAAPGCGAAKAAGAEPRALCWTRQRRFQRAALVQADTLLAGSLPAPWVSE